jgi:hypothetical protein
VVLLQPSVCGCSPSFHNRAEQFIFIHKYNITVSRSELMSVLLSRRGRQVQRTPCEVFRDTILPTNASAPSDASILANPREPSGCNFQKSPVLSILEMSFNAWVKHFARKLSICLIASSLSMFAEAPSPCSLYCLIYKPSLIEIEW